ncbi:MAG TPA: PD-(D/E)XK nuclease family protein, partial [Casimicrobiaceae bacterium]|nr:PD-(D/E)XK nuclease family protein [Casimicrobiaceae bacterium]
EAASGRIATTDAAALVRSPYIPEASQRWAARAMAERTWREQGRHDVSFADVARTLAKYDASLSARWQSVGSPSRAARTPRAWVESWSQWLAALGWPGERSLDSSEWQLREAFTALLVEFIGLGSVTGTLDARSAVSALRAIASERLFQPQSGEPRIRILGVLEAAGLDFDALWLADFAAERWPAAPAPNAFLSIAWQRERLLPRSSGAIELAFAQRLTRGFAAAAPEVVASCARVAREAEQTPSPLFAQWPALDAMPARHARFADSVAARAHALPWRDDLAPTLPAGTELRGGTGLVESQSACPFQAFTRYRLRAEGWPAPGEGLTPIERGILLHNALAAFWTAVRDSGTLARLDEVALDARIDEAVATAIDAFAKPRWRALAPVIAGSEHARIASCIRSWLAIERERPPFAVRAIERGTSLVLGGLKLAFRIDRIDALDDEGIAIIDYKSGKGKPPSEWFAERPAGTQIGLYALAERANAPTRNVRALAYAQLKAGEVRVHGLASDPQAWPQLPTPARAREVPFEDWATLQSQWAERLDAIAREFREGRAEVSPRNGQACGQCDLQSFCRIRALGEEATPHPGESQDE